MSKVLIIGCGYIGTALGSLLRKEGHEVTGVCRTPGTGQSLKESGIIPLLADVTNVSSIAHLPTGFDWIVNCVASTRGDGDDYRAVYLEGTRNLLHHFQAFAPEKFVYTSSTSVYGQNDGSTVTESSSTEPASETSQVLVATERLLLEAAQQRQFPAVILRVAGIYGPGRGYWFKQFVEGVPLVQEGRVINMIHRDDVAGAIFAALLKARSGEIYNAVDDEPVTQLELFRWLSIRLDRPMPPLATQAKAITRKRGVSNKRILNLKLKKELGYRFKYPTFREGYESIRPEKRF